MIFFCIKKTQLMIDTIFYLASCDTCRKIIKPYLKELILHHDIKQDPITIEQLEEMHQMVVMKRCLVKKAQLYKSMGLKDKKLGEDDYKKYILEHYTF
jgi:arsenate reductase